MFKYIFLTVFFVGLVQTTFAQDLLYLVDRYSQVAAWPSFTFKAAPGFSGMWRTGVVGIGGLVAADGRVDGVMVVGTGLGDPYNGIGGSILVVPGSIGFDGGFMEYGMASIEFGHIFKSHLLGVSVGMSQWTLWRGNNKNYIKDPSFYISASRFFETPLKSALTVGIGNNMYADFDYIGNRKAVDKLAFFAAGAIYVLPQMSLIADYTGGLMSLAVSVSPFPKYPINFNVGVNGLFKELKDERVDVLANMALSFAY